jgi:NADH dehydrogenase FAD-containing subunit
VAEAIKAHVAGKGEPPPFRYRNRGKLATVGRKAAVIASDACGSRDGLRGGSGASPTSTS